MKSASTSSQSASVVSPPSSAGSFVYSRKDSHSMSGMPEDFEGVSGGDFGTPIVSVQDAEEHGESWTAVSREELPAVVGRGLADSVRVWDCADLGCIMAI